MKFERQLKVATKPDNSSPIDSNYSTSSKVTLYLGDCIELLAQIPDGETQLVVTSPPYNVGKPYEKKLCIDEYVHQQSRIIKECVRVLANGGSICWQVGNYIESGEVYPLDTLLYPYFKQHGLKLRNRIVWHFEHGLHCKKRFSGRYETIIWFTKGREYLFNLDPVRVPQKYPGKKHFKGPNTGKLSCHPAGKNPGDVWLIPNVKHNHVEKTIHPCQFPVELVERLVLALSDEGDLVLDPFMGVGTTAVAAMRHKRRAVGAETVPEYVEVAKERVTLESMGFLRTRPMHRPIFEPSRSSE